MRFVVKNTTKYGLLDWFCPLSCRGCGALGGVVCECCKKYLNEAHEPLCPLCKQLKNRGDAAKLTLRDYCCEDCGMSVPICVGGWKEGLLGDLVKAYKYQAERAIGKTLAELMAERLPQDLPEDTIVVPLPTIGRHVRERGFDHTLRLAKLLARLRGWQCEKILLRASDAVQVGADAKTRQKQAARAYAAKGTVDPAKTYLLLDDIWTTGASALAAVEAMRKARAEKIVVGVVATGRAREE